MNSFLQRVERSPWLEPREREAIGRESLTLRELLSFSLAAGDDAPAQ